jgi:hypothetical protein
MVAGREGALRRARRQGASAGRRSGRTRARRSAGCARDRERGTGSGMESQFSPLLARMFADKALSLEAVRSYRGTVCARANARNGATHVLSDALAEFLFDAQSTLGRMASASAPCVAAARRGACTMSMRFHGKLGLFCACALVVAPAPALASGSTIGRRSRSGTPRRRAMSASVRRCRST